jgi:hypothetical protein
VLALVLLEEHIARSLPLVVVLRCLEDEELFVPR